ncbi:hypothetical protein [Nocardia arthritidis]|uniref:hypothetical protein n=1 Tax=Nocardia arthritidis TaxID=228602 RepID=UPI000A3E3D9C|nr:hypothetical protein [Nocardia arthritidis]
MGEEPLLFHCGMRALFPVVSTEITRIMPVERLRWITFGHVEADERGAMNLFLTAAPHAHVAHGLVGCLVSLDDLADRLPRRLSDGEVIDLGGRRVRHLDTPHAPHNPTRRRSGLRSYVEVPRTADELVSECTCICRFANSGRLFRQTGTGTIAVNPVRGTLPSLRRERPRPLRHSPATPRNSLGRCPAEARTGGRARRWFRRAASGLSGRPHLFRKAIHDTWRTSSVSSYVSPG